MSWIQLSEEDRTKYGGPEKIPFVSGRWGLKSVDALEQQAGWTMEDLSNGLSRKARDADGNAVTEPVLDDDGNPVLDERGEPKRSEVASPRPMAIAVVVWLALRGVGIRVPWDDFDVSLGGLVIHWADDEGKAPEDQDSATSSTNS